MSVYFVKGKGKGWRYDFTLTGIRYTGAWFKTKTEARKAESKRREELLNPQPVQQTPTDMVFLDLVNLRLDHVKAYNSEMHYQEHVYKARKWVKIWGDLNCSVITQDMIERFVLERNKVSAQTANKEIRLLRALFNFGIKKKLITENPLDGIEFVPVENKVKYMPTPEEIDKVIAVADPDTQDYLLTIMDTIGRMSEINHLAWEDVYFEDRYVILYTRKKKGGHLTPRKVPMTQRFFEILKRRYKERDTSKPWVFWHTYTSSKTCEKKHGPYRDRKRIMRSLCRKAGVKYFRFHPLRHSGASLMDNNNVPMGSIQKLLGHENRRTTEIYLHSIGHAERDAISVFENAVKKSHTNSHTEKKRNDAVYANLLILLVPPARIELAAHGLGIKNPELPNLLNLYKLLKL